jgi:putative proteasome-type protease
MIHDTWGQRLREVFDRASTTRWDDHEPEHPLLVHSERYGPTRKVHHPGEKVV